jgi:hypothetical protein
MERSGILDKLRNKLFPDLLEYAILECFYRESRRDGN